MSQTGGPRCNDSVLCNRDDVVATVAYQLVRIAQEPRHCAIGSRYRLQPGHPDPNVDAVDARRPDPLNDRTTGASSRPSTRPRDGRGSRRPAPWRRRLPPTTPLCSSGPSAASPASAASSRICTSACSEATPDRRLATTPRRRPPPPSAGCSPQPAAVAPTTLTQRQQCAPRWMSSSDDSLAANESTSSTTSLPTCARWPSRPTYRADAVSDLRTVTEFIAAVIAEEPDPAGPATAIVTEILSEIRR